ncbi:MAG: DEAD/DEAH box helicase [Propionibacteriaceae bacterium]|nr:DEAD/DEAH box helicase [Propionibacteriaceae bacterium]
MGRDVSDWVSQVTDETIKQQWGVPALLRGRTHADAGHVRSSEFDEHGELTARVGALGSRTYTTRVRHDQYGLTSTCTCPIGTNCKHAVAALLVAKKTRARNEGRAWEAVLAAMLPPAPAEGTTTGLGLEFSTRTGEDGADVIQLRPLGQTPKGWSHSRAAWSDLHAPYPEAGWEPRQLGLMQQLMHLSPHSPGTATWLSLGELGALAWPLLRRIESAGVAFLPGEGLRAVELDPDPGRLWLEATTLDDGSLQLTADGSLGAFPEGGRRFLIGAPAHGVAELAPGGRLRLMQLTETPPEALRSFLAARAELVIPADDLPRFHLMYLPVLAREGLLADHGPLTADLPAPGLLLKLTHEPGPRLLLEWGFRYRNGSCSADVPLQPGGDGPPRDRGQELALMAQAARLLTRPELTDEDGSLLPQLEMTGVAAARFVTEDVPRLREVKVTIESSGEQTTFQRASQGPEVILAAQDTSERDWFNLNIEIRVAGYRVPLADLLRALASGDDAMLLADGTWFDLDVPQLARLRTLIEEARELAGTDDEDEVRLSPYQLGLMAEFEELATWQRHSKRWTARVQGLLAVGTGEAAVAPPAGLRAELRPYQLDGLTWLQTLWNAGLGGVLADDMGLGKTLQSIALFEQARGRGELDARPVLVVAPASVVGTWADEAARFAPELKVVTIAATRTRRGSTLAEEIRGAHVVVTSYTLLRLEQEQYLAAPWRALVLDEAQFVKNHRSRTHQVVARISASFTLVITGTPLENSLGDLWSMFALAAPGLFPRPASFAERYRNPIENDGDSAALARLRSRIRPFMLRRTKAQVVQELPPKTEQVVGLELAPAHRRIYDQYLTRERVRVLGMLDDVGRNKVAIFQALTRLRQLALDPRLVDPSAPIKESAKITALIDHIQELRAEGHRALVFSSFTGFLGLVRDALTERDIGHVHLDGRTRNRQERITQFREGTDPVFLISLKAGGFGLTLTEADYVFVLDPWWNPAAENQAVDRTHRIGQSRSVNVYRLVATDTIEEKVMALQERKRNLFDAVVDTDEFRSGTITAEDIRDLIE